MPWSRKGEWERRKRSCVLRGVEGKISERVSFELEGEKNRSQSLVGGAVVGGEAVAEAAAHPAPSSELAPQLGGPSYL